MHPQFSLRPLSALATSLRSPSARQLSLPQGRRGLQCRKDMRRLALGPAVEQATEDLGTDLDGHFDVMDAYLRNSDPQPSLVYSLIPLEEVDGLVARS